METREYLTIILGVAITSFILGIIVENVAFLRCIFVAAEGIANIIAIIAFFEDQVDHIHIIKGSLASALKYSCHSFP